MAFNNTKDTDTTDTAPEDDRADRIEPEEWQESTTQPAGDAEADVDGREDGDAPGTSDEVTGGATKGAGLGGFVAGAVAVVSAGLGLSSLTGTPVSEMLRNRQEIIGQIETSAGGGGDQVEALYGAPWHTAALMNGVFALVAVLLGGALLIGLAQRSDPRQWVRALALGGVVLGAIGLVVAGGMYLDMFGPQPELPSVPAPPG